MKKKMFPPTWVNFNDTGYFVQGQNHNTVFFNKGTALEWAVEDSLKEVLSSLF